MSNVTIKDSVRVGRWSIDVDKRTFTRHSTYGPIIIPFDWRLGKILYANLAYKLALDGRCNNA